ncbi:MAG: cryptochrome/photolyase family protein, partial [Candidatus Competibacterales bacterium]|nr:cryptochrome/photolyase family protein [Candidatus Competibacterales bacterium]
REGILVDEDGRPEGGRWNLDADNRASFGKDGPGEVPEPPRFEPDALTREVIALVAARFADHPGRAEDFAQAVTPAQAEQALEDFVRHRLPDFGRYQDALWSGQPFLYHSRLSAVLNLHLLDPRRAVAAAIEAYRESHAPLNSVEGFVRQVLGWREFVRGLYWTRMPEYAGLNALGAEQPLPVFYWDGDTEMRCIRRSMGEALDHAYGHHIQRLMVLGLFAQLLGVHPYRFHEWHMALYADAVDWVSLPNALGMSQHGDGGMMATKPYCASGRYIQRMSNYCRACRYDPARATGDKACPFTTLYWDFLERHGERFRDNRRMRFQLGNLARKSSGERQAIRDQAEALRQRLESGERQ